MEFLITIFIMLKIETTCNLYQVLTSLIINMYFFHIKRDTAKYTIYLDGYDYGRGVTKIPKWSPI